MNKTTDPSVPSDAASTPHSPFPTGESKVGVVHAAPPVAPAPAPDPVVVAETAVPEPVVQTHVVPPPATVAATPAPAPAARPALQESPQVPIPVRMNQLQSKHTALRGDLDALEEALKSPLK